jgi:hypothetical protein
MNFYNGIQNQFDLTGQLFESLQQLENIGTPTIQNAAQMMQIINNVKYITGGNDAEFSTLLQTAIGQNVVSQVQNAVNQVISYAQNITIEVAQPNQPGNYINLYVGTASVDDDGDIDEDFQDEQYDPDGDPIEVAATLWEVISEQGVTLINDAGDAEVNANWCGGNVRQALGCDWGSNGNLSFNCGDYDDYDDFDVAAQGSLSQWLPFIHLDTSNANTGAEQQAMNNFASTFG